MVDSYSKMALNIKKTSPIFFIALSLCIQSAKAATQLNEDVDLTTKYENVGNLSVIKKFLEKKQAFYLYAKGTAKSSSPNGIMMFGLQIACGPDSKNLEIYQTTQNHIGSNANPEGLQLETRYLFIAPAMGDYNCNVQAKKLFGTGTDSIADQKLKLSKDDVNTLSFDSTVEGAGAWGNEHDKSDYDYVQNPTDSESHRCARLVKQDDGTTIIRPIDPPYSGEDANTTTYCKGSTHVGPNVPAGASVYALHSSHWTPILKPNAQNYIKGISDVELTSCYYNTGSCPEYASGLLADKNSGSEVKTSLVIEQYRKDNTKCASVSSPDQRIIISSNVHHLKVRNDLSNVLVNQEDTVCGPESYFVSKVRVTLLKGNPVRIEDSRYSQNMLFNQ
jgi:hypothetical protein